MRSRLSRHNCRWKATIWATGAFGLLEIETCGRTDKILWTKGGRISCFSGRLGGPGLHRVPLNCAPSGFPIDVGRRLGEHVLVDCTPMNLYEVESAKRLSLVMKSKISALVGPVLSGPRCRRSGIWSAES